MLQNLNFRKLKKDYLAAIFIFFILIVVFNLYPAKCVVDIKSQKTDDDTFLIYYPMTDAEEWQYNLYSIAKLDSNQFWFNKIDLDLPALDIFYFNIFVPQSQFFFRINPSTHHYTVLLKSISLKTLFHNHSWDANGIIESFTQHGNISKFSARNGILTIKPDKSYNSDDTPYLAYKYDFNTLITMVVLKNFILSFFISLFIALFVFLLLRFYKIIFKYINKRQNLFVFIFFSLIIFGILTISGSLNRGPLIVDENQIFRLEFELAEKGFWPVLTDELSIRFSSYRRLCPLYLVQKVTEVKFFGDNLLYYTLFSGLIASLTTYFLFRFARIIGFSLIESVFFSLIVMVGSQSIIWSKLLHGEGIGMLMLALALLFMGNSAISQKSSILFDFLSLFFILLATLSKESFVLLIPALLFWKVLLTYDQEKIPFIYAIKKNIYFVILLLSIFIVEIITCKMLTTGSQFKYTGWQGFDIIKFIKINIQFFKMLDGLVILPIVYVIYEAIKSFDYEYFNKLLKNLILNSFLCVLIICPQLLLYMSSGFYNEESENYIHYSRYLLPASLGYAYLVVFLYNFLNKIIYFKNLNLTNHSTV